MSVWMTPDLQPIIGATYFPPEDHPSGQPGFKTVLNHIASTVRNVFSLEKLSSICIFWSGKFIAIVTVSICQRYGVLTVESSFIKGL